MLLQDFLFSSANQFPQKAALIYGEDRTNYGELRDSACSVAEWLLEQPLESGFRGVILNDNPYEYLAAYFGILIAGGVAVGANTQTSDTALAHILTDSGAEVLFCGSKFKKYLLRAVSAAPLLKTIVVAGVEGTALSTGIVGESYNAVLKREPSLNPLDLPYRSPCDYAQIIYTSGTTGKPKGVVLRHSNLIANIESVVSYLKLTSADSIMAVLPFFYSYGNSVLLTHIAVGATLVVNQNFMYPNVILQQMVDYRVTGFSGVPSTFAILLHRSAVDRFTFPDLRYLTQAGAPLSPHLANQLRKIFPGVALFVMYGQTEACARLAYLTPEDLEQRPGSIGKAIPGVELFLRNKLGQDVPVGETGEIVARGENIMAGYWRHPSETAKVLRREGLWTGDLARQDEDGFFYIVSRKSDIIKSGSHRIGPKEIEDVLCEHKAVYEAAVVGVHDEILDERIRACIVLQKDSRCSEKEIKIHCRKNLPAFKIPHEYVFCKDLPKTTTGKVRKSELKAENM